MVLSLTVLAALHVSLLAVPFGSVVFGSPTVWRGHTAAFRLAAVEPQTGSFVGPYVARAVLYDERGERAVAGTEGHGFGELLVAVPADLGQSPRLEVDVAHETTRDHFVLPLRAVDSPSPLPARLSPVSEALAPKSRPARADSYELRLYPRSRVAPAGLATWVEGWLVRSGSPVSARLVGVEPKVDVLTGADGRFAFAMRAAPTGGLVRLRMSEAGVNLTTTLAARAGTPAFDLPTDGVVAPSSSLDVRVSTLDARAPLYLDVWVGEALVHASSGVPEGGARSLKVPLPADARGLAVLTAYSDVFGASSAAATLPLWLTEATGTAAERELAQALALLPGGDPALDAARAGWSRYARLALTRVEPTGPVLPLLRTTARERVAALEAHRTVLRARLRVAFVGSFAVAAFLVVAWGARHRARVRRAMREVELAEDALAAAPELAARARLTRVRDVAELGAALLALALAGYLLWLMLGLIRAA